MGSFKISALVCLGLSLGISSAFAISVKVSDAPSNNLNLTLYAIQSAKKSLKINIYEFTSSEIANAIISKINKGIKVSILEEGQPVGGLSSEGREIQSRIVTAMNQTNGKHHFYEMTSKLGVKKRFRFNHAKYVVIDESSLLIGSENFTPTGSPHINTVGNRGWVTLIHDRALAQEFGRLYDQDSDIRQGDLRDLTQEEVKIMESEVKTAISSVTRVTEPLTLEADSYTYFTSPDKSEEQLVEMLEHSSKSIDLELMTFDAFWKKQNRKSPLFEAVLAAARRGVKIRVLLNDERVFSHSVQPGKNQETVDLLNESAKKEKLQIAAQVAQLSNMHITYIHNKGALIDQHQTLISSINWGENSVKNNRETAVLLDSTSIYAYYEKLFEKDWILSANAFHSGKKRLYDLMNFLRLITELNQNFLVAQ